MTNLDKPMTLRDYLAAKAMQGILANPAAMPDRQEHFDNIAADAYRMADTMLILMDTK